MIKLSLWTPDVFREQQKAYKQWYRRGGGARGRGRGGQGYGRWDQKNQKQLIASIAVRPEWQVLEEMDFPRLAKLSLPNVDAGQDMLVIVLFYDKPTIFLMFCSLYSVIWRLHVHFRGHMKNPFSYIVASVGGVTQ